MTAAELVRVGHAVRMRGWFITARGWLERIPLSLIQLAMRIAVGAV